MHLAWLNGRRQLFVGALSFDESMPLANPPSPGDLMAALVLNAAYAGKYYSVANTTWDRTAFKLLYRLFQMTVTDVAKIGVPVTISK